MATLYELKETIKDVIENGFSVDEETGEILFDSSNLDALQEEREEKIENICCAIKNLNNDASGVDAEAKSQAKRAKALKAKAEWLTNYLQAMLEGEKYESTKCVISYRKSESLEINDMTFIPDEFLKYKEPDVDKMGLKKAIKGGLEIKGVELVTKQNIQIK